MLVDGRAFAVCSSLEIALEGLSLRICAFDWPIAVLDAEIVAIGWLVGFCCEPSPVRLGIKPLFASDELDFEL